MREKLIEYYIILGLEPGASLENVEAAYRDLVQVWHPDRFSHDPSLHAKAEQKMKEINVAYGFICRHWTPTDNKKNSSQTTGGNQVEWRHILRAIIFVHLFCMGVTWLSGGSLTYVLIFPSVFAVIAAFFIGLHLAKYRIVQATLNHPLNKWYKSMSISKQFFVALIIILVGYFLTRTSILLQLRSAPDTAKKSSITNLEVLPPASPTISNNSPAHTPSTSSMEQAQPANTPQYLYVTGLGVNLREGPGLVYQVIQDIKINMALEQLETVNVWVKVRANPFERNRHEALEAGYSIEEVFNYLKTESRYSQKIQKALEEGYSQEEILNSLEQESIIIGWVNKRYLSDSPLSLPEYLRKHVQKILQKEEEPTLNTVLARETNDLLLFLTPDEKKWLEKNGYLKNSLIEDRDHLVIIQDLLETLRSPKEMEEGIFIRESHGANAGFFDIKTSSGEEKSFYWCGSWGHPTLIMKGSFTPLDFKMGEKNKSIFL